MSDSADKKTYGLFSTAANGKLIAELESGGAKVFQFPPIETEKLDSDKFSTDYLENLTDFDWIIFPDIFAVDFFLQALEASETDFFDLDAINVLALGEAVADRLRFVQLHADFIPNFVETEKVFAALCNFIGQKNFGNLQFLVPKETSANIELTEKLTENKAIVTELPIYRATISDKSNLSKLKALLTGGAIDEFVFSSPTDLISLKYLFSGSSISKILAEIESSVIDEVVFQALKEHNQKSKFCRIK